MSMTVPMTEAGLAELAQFLRRRFGTAASAAVRVDEVVNGVVLTPAVDESMPACLDDVPLAGVEYRDGMPYLTGTPALSAEDVVHAIKQSRDAYAGRGIRLLR